MKIKFPSIFVLVIILMNIGAAEYVQAQNEVEMKPFSERIDDVKNMLQLKLLLDKEQLNKINNILIESLPKPISQDSSEATIKSINTKIETVLTKKQKSKFDIIKSNWLDDLIETSE
jgi:hypothetical protein